MKPYFFIMLCWAAVARACGPFFPPSYFNEHWGVNVVLNEREELELIGAHFNPEWRGRRPRGNTIKTAEAHRIDFGMAARIEGLSAAEEEAAWQKYEAFKEGLLERLQAGRRVDVPRNTGLFKEFYLYSLGRDQFRAHPENPEPEAWKRLLALPVEERRFRTVWAYFGLTLAAKTFDDTEAWLAKLRGALDSGFTDTAALEESVLRQLVRRDRVTGVRYLPLLLTAYEGFDNTRARRIYETDFLSFWRHCEWLDKAPAFVDAMMTDRIGREIMMVCLSRRYSNEDGLLNRFLDAKTETLAAGGVVLTADRLAWRAFQCGDSKLGYKLLAMAPEDSMIRLFWEARSARSDKDYARSAELLKRWLALYEARREYPKGVRGWANYGHEFTSYTFPQLVQGNLGVVLVEQGDMMEALYAFEQAGFTADALIVADRFAPLDELTRYAATRNDPDLNAAIQKRIGREEAERQERERRKAWEAEETKFFHAYRNLLTTGDDETLSHDTRATALYNLAKLVSADWNYICGEVRYPRRRDHIGRAMDFAMRAAELADDVDLRVAALLLGGAIPRGQDPQASDRFFKKLCALRPHPVARKAYALNWFPPDALERMVAESDERTPRTLDEIVASVRVLR